MNTKQLIGNDIVDLKTPDALHFPYKPRYIKRVLCEEEQLFFLSKNKSIDLFWSYWSAKEAVYRIIKKKDPNSFFSPHAYQVYFLEKTACPSAGSVTHKGLTYPVTFSRTNDWVHCIATTLNNTNQIITRISLNDEIESDDFSLCPEEMLSVHSKESFLVRCLSKDLLKDLTGKDFQIQRAPLLKKFAPPALWHNGKKCTDIDLSMSHDGSFCAAVICGRAHINIPLLSHALNLQ